MEVGSTGTPADVTEAAHDDDSVMASWLTVDDETASELSKLLDLFEAPPPPVKVRFIDNPYASLVVFQSSSAYVTINGNEESCGSSFSDSDSSVMVSIDLGGAGKNTGWWGYLDSGELREWCMEGSDGFFIDGCGSSSFREDDDDNEAMWVEIINEDVFG